MKKSGRPLGSKKQGAPKKIINQLDKVLRYQNDLILVENIDDWIYKSCNINISLPVTVEADFNKLITYTLEDKNFLKLETIESNIHPFVVDQYHLLYIATLKILEEISAEKISPKKLHQIIVDAITTIENSYISFSVIAVSPITFSPLQSYKINLSEEIQNLLKTKEFQSKMKEKYIQFWKALETTARSVCLFEQSITREPKTLYKLKNHKSKKFLIEVLNDLESPIPDDNKNYSSILEIASPKHQNREYVCKLFGLNKSALKK